MSDPLLSTLHDPNYGRVKDLCKALGYDREGDEHTRAPRSVSFLRNITGEYRKQFVASCAGLERFPLDYQSTEVQQCVLEFLSKNTCLFDNSDEAQYFGWPVYPDDGEQLTNGLAKLMCQQEFLQRRNIQTRQKEARQESIDSSIHSSGDESDSERSEIYPESVKRAISTVIRQAQEERNAINLDKAKENAEIHLEFIFPLDGIAEERTSEWVFDKNHHWPDHAKRFSWRYFHEHSLYSLRKKNSEALSLFAETFKRYLNIRCTREEDVTIRKRCAKQISGCAGKWRIYGFLEHSHAFPRKTTQFQAAWLEARQLWLDRFYDGIPPIGLKVQRSASFELPGSEIGTGNKRAYAHVEEVCDIYEVPLDDPPSGSGAKRARIKALFADTASGSRTTNQELHTFDTAPPVDEDTIAVDAARSREPKRALEALIHTRAPAQGQNNNRVQAERAQTGSAARQPPASGHNLPHINQGLAPLPLASAAARRDAKVNGGLDASTLSKDRRTPYALSGESLNIPFSTDTALVKVSRPATTSKPAKPQLLYIVPNSTGALDYDHPLPRTEFVDSKNLSDFFKTIARRAGKPVESPSCLTFTYNWGKREAFVVNRYGSDSYWEGIRERVKGNFLKARNSMPNRTLNFELWIECGDTTKMDEVEEDDDY